ncbi:hypothetical protein MMC09_005571 [Bachmanniomyces sp. S44760]|nr:hypothetical protein [Bachmanniomyces sp. S44760]
MSTISPATDGGSPLPALLHRSLHDLPHSVINAQGIELFLKSGQTIIDACGGAAVSILGHGNEEVIAAATVQMRKLSYVHTGAYTTDAAEELAHHILKENPYGLEKVYFAGSGSEAMDGAMKLARQYWFEKGEKGRTHFVARKQSWHGTTIGPLSLGSNLPRKIPYEPLLMQNVSHVSPAFAYHYRRQSETEEQYVGRLAHELDEEFLRIGPKRVIAFVAEPVVGATSGCTPAPKGYFRAIREVCDRYDILLILDEVMCGMGRTGTYFAFEQEDIVPDIMTIGKGLGGGYAPIAGIVLHSRVVDTLRRGTAVFNHGHTYQAHPVNCATALAVQKIVRRDKLVDRSMAMGKILGLALKQAFANAKHAGDIRGRGLFWAVEFVDNKETKETFDPALGFGVKVQLRAFKLGVAVYPGVATFDGVSGDHVIIAPPYNVTESQLETIVRVLRQAYDIEERMIHQDISAG